MSNEYRTPSRDASAAPTAVLFSGGLDSAVLVADAARTGPVRALYVSVEFAWEAEERAMASRLFASPPLAGIVDPPVDLQLDMRDVFPPRIGRCAESRRRATRPTRTSTWM